MNTTNIGSSLESVILGALPAPSLAPGPPLTSLTTVSNPHQDAALLLLKARILLGPSAASSNQPPTPAGLSRYLSSALVTQPQVAPIAASLLAKLLTPPRPANPLFAQLISSLAAPVPAHGTVTAPSSPVTPASLPPKKRAIGEDGKRSFKKHKAAKVARPSAFPLPGSIKTGKLASVPPAFSTFKATWDVLDFKTSRSKNYQTKAQQKAFARELFARRLHKTL